MKRRGLRSDVAAYPCSASYFLWDFGELPTLDRRPSSHNSAAAQKVASCTGLLSADTARSGRELPVTCLRSSWSFP